MGGQAQPVARVTVEVELAEKSVVGLGSLRVIGLAVGKNCWREAGGGCQGLVGERDTGR